MVAVRKVEGRGKALLAKLFRSGTFAAAPPRSTTRGTGLCRRRGEAGGVRVEQAQAERLPAMLTAAVRTEPLDDDVRQCEQVGGHGE